MNLDSITEVRRPATLEGIRQWRQDHAWLAGGTWLFSEPQPALRVLIDLEQLGWTSLQVTPAGLDIAATCRIVELHEFAGPAEWKALPLLRLCCESLLGSFKIWNAATVGGNICMSLPAGPMTSLAVALEAILTLWPREGAPRELPALDFVTGNHKNLLRPGEVLRNIRLPAEALAKRFAFRRASLTHLGRSAALIAGTCGDGGEDLVLTITAATPRPIQLRFAAAPSAETLAAAIDEAIPADGYFGDVHGSAAYKRHLTYHFAEQIRAELAAGVAP
jgi:CO/xanthine dehydrogenase FAD-binding subunit